MLRVTLLRLRQAEHTNNQYIITRISVTLSVISFQNPIKSKFTHSFSATLSHKICHYSISRSFFRNHTRVK